MAEDPYTILTRHFNPVNAMTLQAAPPQAPFGKQAPGFPSELAASLMKSEQKGRETGLEQEKFKASLAQNMELARMRQKQESDLDRQYKETRIAAMKQKMERLAQTNPYILKDMTILNSMYNRISANVNQGIQDDPEHKKLVARADALETHLSPYMGIKKEQMREWVPGILWGGEYAEKEVYKSFGQIDAEARLKPMTDVERTKAAALRQRGVPEEKIKEAFTKDGFAWAP